MAGIPLTPASPTVLEVLRRLQTLGFCLDLDASAEDSINKKPSSPFDRILSTFFKEIHLNQEIRPIPAFLGDGKAVDLFALYREVAENGGCVSVTKNRMWDAVGERIGCDSGSGSSVKLVYFKYLDELNRCLVADFCSKERESSSPDVLDPSKKLEDFELKPLSGLEKNDEEEDGDGDGVVILDPVEVDRKCSWLKKRKRDPLVGMLNWLLLVARNPCDPSIGKITGDDGEDREFAVGALFSQVLMARHALFHQKKEGSEKIHPLTNEDGNGDDEKLSSSNGLKSLKAHFQPGSCSETTTFIPKDGCAKDLIRERIDHNHYKKRLRSSSEDILGSLPVPPKTDPVLLGASHQAEVPDWTARASVSSSDVDELKWLGTQIWPPEKKVNNRLLIERDPICKGRQDTCGCQSPGSVDCVRFHVREKRNRLKLELGPAFYSWKFDRMGEEVAQLWTEEEELRFKAVVRLNPPSYQMNLFQQLCLTFPRKKRKDVLSYYFNVFLLRRRSYQNRETPESIDSD